MSHPIFKRKREADVIYLNGIELKERIVMFGKVIISRWLFYI